MRLTKSHWTLFFRKAFCVMALVCGLSMGWLVPSSDATPALAVTKPALTQPEPEIESRVEAYEEAKEIAKDPKMGIEKEYEKEIEVYQEEHSEGTGILEEAKELVNKVTGS